MATNTEEIYLKLKVDTGQFNSSMSGMKREIASLRGLIGSNLLSSQENTQLQGRMGELKNKLDDIKIASNNIDTGDVFGNMARLGGVAANAVAGVTGAMSLLGVESKKAGEVEKQILQFMSIGNALQAVADSKRLFALAQIYAAELKNFLFRKKAVSELKDLGGDGEVSSTAVKNTEAMTTATVANTSANVAQTGSIAAQTVALKGLTGENIMTTAAIKAETAAVIELERQVAILEGELTFLTNETNDYAIAEARLAAMTNELTLAQERRRIAIQALVVTQGAEVAAVGATTIAMRLQAAGMWLVTAAKKALDLAMAAGPMLLLVAALGLLYGAFKGIQWIIQKSQETQNKAIDSWIKSIRILGELKKASIEATKEQKKLADELYETELQLAVLRGDITQKQADRLKAEREGVREIAKISLDYAKALQEQKRALSDLQELQRKGIIGQQLEAASKRVTASQQLINQYENEFEINRRLIIQKQEVINLNEDETKSIDEKTIALQKEARAQEEFADALFKMGLDENFDPLKKTLDRLKSKPAQIPIKLEAIWVDIDNFFKTVENRIKATHDLNILNIETSGIEKYQDGLNKLIKLREELARIISTPPLPKNGDIVTEEDKAKWAKQISDAMQMIDEAMKTEKEKMLQTFDEAINAVGQFIPQAFQATYNSFANMMAKIKSDIPITITDIITAVGALSNDIMNTVFGQLNQEIQDNLTKNLNALTEQYDRADRQLQKLRDNKQISDEAYEAKKRKLDAERAAKEKAARKKAFEQQKELALIQAIINTALAVTAALTGGPVVGLVLAGLAALAGAAEIAIISSQTAPEFAKGGVVQGPSHSVGGVPITAEGGEYIINKNVTQRPGMISYLNKINTGENPNNISNNQFDPDTLRLIVSEIINGTKAIPVNVVEVDMTKTQRKVNVMEGNSQW